MLYWGQSILSLYLPPIWKSNKLIQRKCVKFFNISIVFLSKSYKPNIFKNNYIELIEFFTVPFLYSKAMTWSKSSFGFFHKILQKNLNKLLSQLNICCLNTRSCPTLCNPMDNSHQAPLFMGFPRQEYCSGLPFPSPTQY